MSIFAPSRRLFNRVASGQHTRRSFVGMLASVVPGSWLARFGIKPTTDIWFEPDPSPVAENTGQPTALYVTVFDVGDMFDPRTVIVRRWADGDSAKCRLCPAGRCLAQRDVCSMLVRRAVNPDDALTFDANGLTWPKSK